MNRIEIKNVDVNSAYELLLDKTGRIKRDGSATPKYTESDQELVAFWGGVDAAINAECFAKTPTYGTGPGGNTRGERLKFKANALIKQNPPRDIRPWSKLPIR